MVFDKFIPASGCCQQRMGRVNSEVFSDVLIRGDSEVTADFKRITIVALVWCHKHDSTAARIVI